MGETEGDVGAVNVTGEDVEDFELSEASEISGKK